MNTTQHVANTATTPFAADSAAPLSAWELARKRTNDYLKLHRLADATREQVLTRVSQQLLDTTTVNPSELIALFIEKAQQELAALSANGAACCQCSKTAEKEKPENRMKTGPRVERSSIRVAPLKSIELLPSIVRVSQH